MQESGEAGGYKSLFSVFSETNGGVGAEKEERGAKEMEVKRRGATTWILAQMFLF